MSLPLFYVASLGATAYLKVTGRWENRGTIWA